MPSVFASLLSKLGQLQARYPVLRGMSMYAVIWPCSSVAQEYLEHGTPLHRANWKRAGRYAVFGSFFMAPVFYSWLKLTSPYFKDKTLRTAVMRAALEQISYGPAAVAYFLFGMSAMEGKKVKVCIEEVKQKFWSVYEIGLVYWPTIQTINFRFVPDNNRIVFVAMASFVWTCYLAHIKSIKSKHL